MHTKFCFASGLSAALLLSACVGQNDRGRDSEDLRDPWFLVESGQDAALAAGKEIFVSCASCHLADASGRPDGSIPRLAGQRASVLERRLRGLIDGSINLPVMTPFARALTDSEIREVSAYLESFPQLRSMDATSGAAQTPRDRGAKLYGTLCSSCHSSSDRSLAGPIAPRICGQHEAYLQRRLVEMAGLAEIPNREKDSVMQGIAKALSPEDRLAVSNYLARSECGK